MVETGESLFVGAHGMGMLRLPSHNNIFGRALPLAGGEHFFIVGPGAFVLCQSFALYVSFFRLCGRPAIGCPHYTYTASPLR